MPLPGTSKSVPLRVGGERPRPEAGFPGVHRRRRGVGCVGSGKEFTATITTPVMKGLSGGNSERQLSDEADVHLAVSITLLTIHVLPSLVTKTSFARLR